MKPKITFSLILLILSLQAFTQQNCACTEADKLRPQIGGYFNSGKLDSAEIIITQLKNSKNKVCQIVYLDGVAQVNVAKKQFEKARQLLLQEEVVQNELKCKKLMIRFNNTMARYYQEAGFRDSVSIASLKALALAEEEKDWYAATRACINIGAIFEQEKQQEKALAYNKKALDLGKKAKDTVLLATALVNLSSGYQSLYDKNKNNNYLDTAYLYANDCINISRNKMVNLIISPEGYNNISRYYIEKKDYNKAIAYADTAITICPKGVFDFYRHLLIGYKRKSNIYLLQKEFIKAKQMADSAYAYAEKFNVQLTIEPLQYIHESSKALGDNKNALWAHEKLTFLKDSIFTAEKNSAINELEKKYNQAKNEKTIKELALQKKIYLLLAFASLLGLVAIAFWIRQQSLKHKQTIMETEQRLNRARMNPHFFFNALASLQSFAIRENDGEAIASNLSKFSHIMRETLESTYKDYVTVEQEIDFLNEYLDVQKIRFPKKFEYHITADKNLEIDEMQLPAMIIQPFAENSIEHGFSDIEYTGQLNIHFSNVNNELQIQITDNGKGLLTGPKQDNEHISRASQIIKDRIYLLNIKLKTKARFTIDNNKGGKGVIVKINLPLIYA